MAYLYSTLFMAGGLVTSSPHYYSIGLWVFLCNLGVRYNLWLRIMLPTIHLLVVSPFLTFYTLSGKGRRVRENTVLRLVELVMQLCILYNGLLAGMILFNSTLTSLICQHPSSWQCTSMIHRLAEMYQTMEDVMTTPILEQIQWA